MQNARFQLMHTFDVKLCSHLMFENSFRNIERQNNYRNFLDDRLELWPSIVFVNDRNAVMSIPDNYGQAIVFKAINQL